MLFSVFVVLHRPMGNGSLVHFFGTTVTKDIVGLNKQYH